jgi:hypothetical protein
MSIKFCLLIVVLLTLMMSPRCGQSMPAECKAFYAMTAKEQQAAFKTYLVEKQYEIYRCGTTQRHPPDMGLAIYIAEGGEKNIPFFLQKLSVEKSEAVQMYIIDVFKIMSWRGHLRGREDVAVHIEQVVSKMTIPFIKETSQESLESIKKSL